MRVQQAPQLPPRERIVEAAHSLFTEQGIARVSVEAIATLATSTKMTVYRHFENKDALVLEWLERLIEHYTDVLDNLAQRFPDSPREQLLGFTGFIVDDLQRSGYRGCPFTNSLAEIPEPDHPARLLIETHKQRQFARIQALCSRMSVEMPQELAAELTLLMEGAQVAAQNKGIDRIGERLVRIITRLLPNE